MNEVKQMKYSDKDLEKLYKSMVKGKKDLLEVSHIMQDGLKGQLEDYINIALNGKEKSMSQEDRHCLYWIIQITQFLYNYSGFDTGLTDQEYDIIYEMYINFGNEEIITPDLPFKASDTAEHDYPSLRGTLTKVYYLFDNEVRKNPTRKYLSEWIRSREREIHEKTGRKVNLNNTDIYVFPKWDGVSCIFEFNPDGSLKIALTRGNVYTNVAQNITKSFPNMRGNQTKNGYGLKTEIMMKEEDLDYFNKKYGTTYKNTRSVVSSILNSDSLDERNDLLFIQKLRNSTIENGEETLQTLDDFVFTQPFIRCKLGDVEKIKEFAEAHRFVNGLRCDGAVIYIIDRELQKILGREDNKNKYEVAYKFTEEAQLTKLKDVIFQVGLFGELAPVAIVKPVKLKGNTITRVSLGSMQRFDSLELRKGDTVKVLYDIIPYLVFDNDCKHNNDEKKIKAPHKCPYCHEELEKNEDGIYSKCINPNCVCRKKGAILNYLNKIGIDNCSYATVDTFYDNKFIHSIPDLYRLKDHYKELIQLDGFGEASINSILDSIDNHRVIPDYQLLGAIGIDSVSTETFKLLLSYFPMDKLMKIAHKKDYDILCEIPGIKEKKAKKIIHGLIDKESVIDDLMNYVTVTHPNISKAKFSVAFTKVRDEDIEKEIARRGGEIHDQLKKDTTYLVVPNLSINSSKMEKAKKYGTKIVPIDDIIAVIDRDEG